MWISVRTLICIEKLLFQLASVWMSQQLVRTTLSDWASDFFTSSNIGRLLQPSGQRGFPFGRSTPKVRIAIQIQPFERQSTMVRARAKQIWKLRVEDQPSGWPSHLVRMHEALYGNYLQRTCDRLDDSASPFRRGSQTGKIFRENLRTASVLITAVAHLNPQSINRGPWALRTAWIRYWIPSELRELFCEVIGVDLFSLKPLQVWCCCAIIEVYLRGRP
jgi:hypothetical protein